MSFEPYSQLRLDLSRLSLSLDQIHAQHLNCRAGCADCCEHHLNLFQVEADVLAAAIQTLPTEVQEMIKRQARAVLASERQACPLLIDARCSVYDVRPVICRSHGYPIQFASEVEGEVFLDMCPLNFTAEDALEHLDLNQTLDIDRLNLRLSAINYVYCRDIKHDVALADQRVPIAEIILRESLV